jgi:hypothetical protein
MGIIQSIGAIVDVCGHNKAAKIILWDKVIFAA